MEPEPRYAGRDAATPASLGGVASCAARARAGGASPLTSAPWPVCQVPPRTGLTIGADRITIGAGRPTVVYISRPTDAHPPQSSATSVAAFLCSHERSSRRTVARLIKGISIWLVVCLLGWHAADGASRAGCAVSGASAIVYAEAGSAGTLDIVVSVDEYRADEALGCPLSVAGAKRPTDTHARVNSRPQIRYTAQSSCRTRN
jgi:hypothetical protein